MTFDRSELIAALEAAVAGRGEDETPNSITTREFRESRPMGAARASRLMRDAVTDGVLRPEMIVRRNLHGYLQHVMGYVFVSER